MNAIDSFRNMTVRDLAVFGIQHMAYVRPTNFDGAQGFGIFAADGTQVAFAPSRALAEQTVREHELELATIH
jgi:hypothetical protein